MKRYWFVAVPALMINIGMTLDHVIATNNETAYRVMVNATALEVMASKAQDEQPLSDTLQSHWVTTNEQGNLLGRISAIEPSDSLTIPIERLNVALLQKGQKVRTGETDEEGKFVLEDVEAGVYTIVAAGSSGFLAYGIQVLPKLEGFDVLNKKTQLNSAKTRAYYASHFNVPQDAVVVDELQIDAAAVPPEFSSLQRITQNYLPATSRIKISTDDDDAKALDKADDIKGGFRYPLTASGALEGRMQPITSSDGAPTKLSEMNVFLIQDDFEAARVTVEENGEFVIEDVEPGVYSLIAAGKDGFAALSLQLTAAGNQSSLSGKTKAYYVSTDAAPRKVSGLAIAYDPDPENRDAAKEIFLKEAYNPRQQLLNQQNPANQFATNQFRNPNQSGNLLQPPPSIVDSGFPSGALPGSDFVPGGGGFPGGGAGGGGGGAGGGGNFFGSSGSGMPGPRLGPLGGGRGGGRIVGLIGLVLGITAIADDNSNPGVDPPDQSPISVN